MENKWKSIRTKKLFTPDNQYLNFMSLINRKSYVHLGLQLIHPLFAEMSSAMISIKEWLSWSHSYRREMGRKGCMSNCTTLKIKQAVKTDLLKRWEKVRRLQEESPIVSFYSHVYNSIPSHKITLEEMDAPPQYPDLNMTEAVFRHLRNKRRLITKAELRMFFKTVGELFLLKEFTTTLRTNCFCLMYCREEIKTTSFR